MLQVKHLTAIQEKNLRVLLEDVNFTLGPGDKAAVIGEEGNGKSTLLKLIYDPRLVSGQVSWSGEIVTGGWKLGYLPQELSQAEKEQSIYLFCAEREGFFDATPPGAVRYAGGPGPARGPVL